MTKGYYTVLPGRSAITVRGADAGDFLQGLVTQDIQTLKAGRLSYSALLTAQGKFDYDFFMRPVDDGIELECETRLADALVARLSMFKLRKAITITAAPVDVFAAWGDECISTPRDPRHVDLGFRMRTAPDGFTQTGFDVYDVLRLSLGVPDGSRDFARGEDTVADMGLEDWNGVSFTKGCYMGQELTSRMHHRGLAKKALYPVRISGDVLPPFTDIVVDGHIIGEMRSSHGQHGLAMLRHDALDQAKKAGLVPLPRHKGTDPT